MVVSDWIPWCSVLCVWARHIYSIVHTQAAVALKQTKSAIKKRFCQTSRVEPPWPSGRVHEFGGSGPGFSI